MKRALAGAALAAAFAGFDSGILVLALPAIGSEFGAGVPELTRAAALLSLGAFAAVPIGAFADRRSRRGALALAVAGFSLASAASALAPTLVALAIARALAVCAEAAALAVATAVVIERAPAGRRGLAVAGLTLAAGAGLAAATIAYPAAAPHWRVLYAAGAAGVLAAPAVLRLVPPGSAPVEAVPAPPGPGAGFARRLGLIAAFAGGSAVLFQPATVFAVLYGSRAIGLGPAALSTIVAAAGVAGAAGFAAGGLLTDRFGRRRPAFPLLVLTAAGAAAAFLSVSAPAYAAWNVAWSLLASLATPVTASWFAELLPAARRATGEAVIAGSVAAGGVVGLLAVGALEPALGLGRATAVMALVAIAAVGFLVPLPETAETAGSRP